MIYVVIPVYNVAAYLAKCLYSVFAQTGTDFFIVCINDGSTDRSQDILDSFASKHSNMTVIKTSNSGLPAARNKGIDYAVKHGKEGDCLYFLDSDDWISSCHLSHLLGIMKEFDCEVVSGSFASFRDDGIIREYQSAKINTGVYSGVEAARLLLMDTTIQSHSWGKLYSLRLWNGIRFREDIFFMEDQCTTYKLFLASKNVFLDASCGYFYRQRANSLCALPLNNAKVLSALKSYMVPCTDPALPNDLLWAAHQGLAGVYLMYYWRFERRKATLAETLLFRRIQEYVRLHKVIRNYRPPRRKDGIKRFVFLFFRPFFRPTYRHVVSRRSHIVR